MNEHISPKLISSVPKNKSIDIFKNTSIKLEFNEIVYTTNEGKIIIKDFKNNKTFDTILSDSLLIVGSGSNTITVHLSKTFKDFTKYYVFISPKCFKNINGIYFSGINNKNLISFTTAKNTVPKLLEYYISSDLNYIYLIFNKQIFNRKGENLNIDHFDLEITKGNTKLSSRSPISLSSDDNITFKLEIKFNNNPVGDEIIKVSPFKKNSIFDSDQNPWNEFQIITLKDNMKKITIKKSKELINKNIDLVNSNLNIKTTSIKRNNLFFDQNIIPKVFYTSTINRNKKDLFNDIVNNPLVAKQIIYFNQLNLNQAFIYKKEGKIYGTSRVPWKLETLNQLFMTYNEQVDFYLYTNRVPFYQSNFSYLLMQIKNVLSQLAYSKNLYYNNKVISYKPDGTVRTPLQLINLIKKFT